jgi:hypothetical protein
MAIPKVNLQDDERLIKTVHHHPTAFGLRLAKIIITSFPFFFLAFLASFILDSTVNIIVFMSITLLFSIVLLYDFLMFYLDALVITSKRVVHVDWVNLFRKKESEAKLDDIQDIQTWENGFLAKFRIFDYGHFELETASTKTTIVFTDADDPEGIKHFIYSLSQHHRSLHPQIKTSDIVQPKEVDKIVHV